MITFVSLKHMMVQATAYIPNYKRIFAATFQEIPSDYNILEKRKDYFLVWKKEEPEYYTVARKFWSKLKEKYGHVLDTYHKNFINSLIPVMPDLVDYARQEKVTLPTFSQSQYFLKNATIRSVPLEYYPFLTLILLVEYRRQEIEYIKDKERKEKELAKINRFKDMFHWAYMELAEYVSIMKEKISIDWKKFEAKPTDVYFYKDNAYSLTFFRESIAKAIVILGSKGSGKTIGLERIIQVALAKKYTVIVFGDPRKEFRYASVLYKAVFSNFTNALYRTQKEKAKGFPITIYTKKPEYKIEKSIKSFKGQWDKLEGVVVFDCNMRKVLQSLYDWRSKFKNKKMIIAINEAQAVASSVADKKEWKEFYAFQKFFIHARGLRLPMVYNTQLLSQVKKQARDVDEIFVSHIGDKKERDLIAQIFNQPKLAGFLGDKELKDRHYFYRVSTSKGFQKIKFLVPTCMQEYGDLDKYLEKKK